MKLRNLFYLLLAMPLLAVGCTKNSTDNVKPEPQPEPQPNQPKLTLVSDDVMDFAAEGGEGVIEYTLENAVEGTTLAANCEADWVADVTVGETVTFTVEANEVEEARETSVVVSYGELSVVVTVKQAAYKAAPLTPVFELVSEATMEFGQASAVGTIEFKLENPVDGVNVTAKSNQSWVNNVSVRQADSEIAFMVDANTGAAREATITATYGMLEFKVVVKQAEYVAPAPEIVIESVTESFETAGGEGEIAFSIKNAVEGVEATATTTAEWITVNSCANGIVAFSVAANETESLREGIITLAYGEVTKDVKIQQLFEGYNPNVTYGVFEVIEVRANAIANDTWNLILFENNQELGNPMTRITVKLPEANAFYITDGTYSVADGTIIPNTSQDTGVGSYFRYNGNGSSIYDATLTISVDKENETAKFNGVFKIAGAEYTFEWDGPVDGFVYEEIGDEGITEWDDFYIYSQWDDRKYIVAQSAGIKFEWYVIKLGGVKADPLAVGTYVVGDWEYTTTRDYIDSSSSKINGVLLENGGVVTITEDPKGYKFEFDVTDKNGTSWKGTYVGPITTK